jgi:hypothetical protein
MNPMIKPWLFRGWEIDLIGQIYPPSSKGHKSVLVAIYILIFDYNDGITSTNLKNTFEGDSDLLHQSST